MITLDCHTRAPSHTAIRRQFMFPIRELSLVTVTSFHRTFPSHINLQWRFIPYAPSLLTNLCTLEPKLKLTNKHAYTRPSTQIPTLHSHLHLDIYTQLPREPLPTV